MQDPELITSIINIGNIVVGLLACILGTVALIVTVIGFFASQKFYQDGVKLQTSANETLVTIREKTGAIQGHVEGLINKMLTALIEGRAELSNDFEGLDEQVKQVFQEIKETALQEIGVAGEEEIERISAIVDGQMVRLREQVSLTQESAKAISDRVVEEAGRIVYGSTRPPPSWEHRKIVRGLKYKHGPMSEAQFNVRFLDEVDGAVDREEYRNALSYARQIDSIIEPDDKE